MSSMANNVVICCDHIVYLGGLTMAALLASGTRNTTREYACSLYDMREIRQTRDRLSARELAELDLKIKAYAVNR